MDAQPNAEKSSLVTMDDAAARLSISRKTLEGLVAEGAIAVIRLSARRVAIEESEILRFIGSRRTLFTPRR